MGDQQTGLQGLPPRSQTSMTNRSTKSTTKYRQDLNPIARPSTEKAGAGVSGAGHVLSKPPPQAREKTAYVKNLLAAKSAQEGPSSSSHTQPMQEDIIYTTPPPLNPIHAPQPMQPFTTQTKDWIAETFPEAMPPQQSFPSTNPDPVAVELGRLRDQIRRLEERNQTLEKREGKRREEPYRELDKYSLRGSPPSSPGSSDGSSSSRGGTHLPRSRERRRRRDRSRSPLIKIKAALPDLFDGSTSKLEDWIRQMENMFTLQEKDFRSNRAKIIVAFQHCREGTAARWANYHNEQYNRWAQGLEYDKRAVWKTWSEMKDAMKQRFGDRYEQETARGEIDKARQGNRRVQQYIEGFKYNSYKANYPEDILCQKLLGGVNNELFDFIKTKSYIPMNSLDHLVHFLEKAEKQYVERALTIAQRQSHQGRSSGTDPQQGTYFQNTRKEVVYQRSSQPARLPPRQPPPPAQTKPSPVFQRPTQPQAPRPPADDPMDVDRIRKRNLANTKCYKCRQFGHMARDCKMSANEIKASLLKDPSALDEILATHIRAMDLNPPRSPSPPPEAPVVEEDEPFDVNHIYPSTSMPISPPHNYAFLYGEDKGFH